MPLLPVNGSRAASLLLLLNRFIIEIDEISKLPAYTLASLFQYEVEFAPH